MTIHRYLLMEWVLYAVLAMAAARREDKREPDACLCTGCQGTIDSCTLSSGSGIGRPHAQMNFYGKSVVIRAIEEADLPALASFYNDPEVSVNLEFSWPISAAQQKRFFERNLDDSGSKRWVIATEKEGVIGYTGLWGIDWVHRRATQGTIIGRKDLYGRGLATDALMTVMAAAFDYAGLHRLDAEIYEDNEASFALYTQKCGWKQEGRRRQYIFRDGRYQDVLLVGILADEYRAHRDLLGLRA